MYDQLEKYTGKIQADRSAISESIAFAAQDDVMITSGEPKLGLLASNILEQLNCLALVIAKPSLPFAEFLLKRAATGIKQIEPRDTETRTFLHDIPVLRQNELSGRPADSIARLLGNRKGIIVEGVGIIATGSLTVEQAYINWSSVFHSTFIKYLEDILDLGFLLPEEASKFSRFREEWLLPLTDEGLEFRSGPFIDKGIILDEMARVGSYTVKRGLVDSFFGNISYSNGNLLYISQTASSLDELPGCIDPVPFANTSTVGITASSELAAHRSIFETTGCRAILHGHPRFAVVMSMQCEEKKNCAVSDCWRDCTKIRTIGGTPVVAGEIGAGGIAKNVPPVIGEPGKAIVYGHGVFSIGMNDFAEAFRKLIDVENWCRKEYFRRFDQMSKTLLSLLFILLLFSSYPVHAAPATPSTQHYVIVLDNSGSMKKAGASLRARKLIGEFQNRLKPNDKFTVISFGAKPRIILEKKVTPDAKRRGVIDKKLLSFSEMFTDLNGGFSFLLDFLEKHKSDPDQTFVLFLTDGELDLVSQKNALFPESILQADDYKELLSRYAPYIRKNSIQREKIAAFNKEVNHIGANSFTREIIPKLKSRTTPLFILTFADQSPLLNEISQQIALKEGMKNYFLIKKDQDQENFLNSFFSYVVRLEKLKGAGQFAEVRSNNPTIQTALPLQPPKRSVKPSPETDHWYAILWISAFLGISAFVLFNMRRFLKKSRAKVIGNKSMAADIQPEDASAEAATADVTSAEAAPEATQATAILPPVVKKTGRSTKSNKKNHIKPQPQPQPVVSPVEPQENVTVEENLTKDSEELKNKLLHMEEQELLDRLKQLDEFQRNALAETDEYLNSMLNKLQKELNKNIDTKLALTEKRQSFRHIIPDEYPFYFGFSAHEFNLQGKVLDISQDGVGLATSSAAELTTLDDGVSGELTLILNDEKVAVLPANVAYFDTESDRFGISSLGFKKNPDLKLLWLETFTKILDDLKRLKNDNS